MEAVSKLSNVYNKSFAPLMRSVFSNLRKHDRTVSNLCSARRENVVEKVSPSSRTTKFSFFPFHLFLVGATNTSSAFIHPLLKLPNCVLKQQPRILQLSEVLGFFGFLPFRGAGTGFVSVLPRIGHLH